MRALFLATALSLPAVPALAAGLTLTSPDFANGATIPTAQVFNEDGCTGQNISPALAWSGAPPGTKSFAITIHDPDAPGGGGWWHWTVFNIPPSVHSLPANAGAANHKLLPPGAVEGLTDFGFSHYGGPCPPVGDPPHHYQITVYAVKVAKLPLDQKSTGDAIGFTLHFETLATARLTGLYGRP